MSALQAKRGREQVAAENARGPRLRSRILEHLRPPDAHALLRRGHVNLRLHKLPNYSHAIDDHACHLSGHLGRYPDDGSNHGVASV